MINKLLAHKSLLRQLFFFALFGVIATLTHYFIALALIELGNLNIFLANLGGYCSAVSVSFFGHGKVTFKADLNSTVFRKFVFVSVLTFLASEAILLLLEQTFALPHRVAMGVIVVTIPIISFVVNKFWVFTHKTPSDTSLQN